jgi:hypothetical protein
MCLEKEGTSDGKAPLARNRVKNRCTAFERFFRLQMHEIEPFLEIMGRALLYGVALVVCLAALWFASVFRVFWQFDHIEHLPIGWRRAVRRRNFLSREQDSGKPLFGSLPTRASRGERNPIHN